MASIADLRKNNSALMASGAKLGSDPTAPANQMRHIDFAKFLSNDDTSPNASAKVRFRIVQDSEGNAQIERNVYWINKDGKPSIVVLDPSKPDLIRAKRLELWKKYVPNKNHPDHEINKKVFNDTCDGIGRNETELFINAFIASVKTTPEKPCEYVDKVVTVKVNKTFKDFINNQLMRCDTLSDNDIDLEYDSPLSHPYDLFENGGFIALEIKWSSKTLGSRRVRDFQFKMGNKAPLAKSDDAILEIVNSAPVLSEIVNSNQYASQEELQEIANDLEKTLKRVFEPEQEVVEPDEIFDNEDPMSNAVMGVKASPSKINVDSDPLDAFNDDIHF